MSALLHSPNLFRSLRRISEQEAITTIGRLAIAAADAATGLESVATVALRLRGLHGVQVRLHAGSGKTETLEWHDSKEPAPRGSATGLIVANAREWGRIRILFEPRINSVECPLRFARILGQQAALMLNHIDLRGRTEAAQSAVRRIKERLETRKAVSRAAGILAQQGNLTLDRATLLLLRQARHSKLRLLPVARALILGEETGHLRPIALRRLADEDLTCAVRV